MYLKMVAEFLDKQTKKEYFGKGMNNLGGGEGLDLALLVQMTMVIEIPLYCHLQSKCISQQNVLKVLSQAICLVWFFFPF